MWISRNVISIDEFKILLNEMLDNTPDIGIRFRMMGEMWSQSFSNILFITEHGLVLNDPSTRSLQNIYNIENVVQFELDQRFKDLEPYFHYEVVLLQRTARK
jgi:hypothetical protein